MRRSHLSWDANWPDKKNADDKNDDDSYGGDDDEGLTHKVDGLRGDAGDVQHSDNGHQSRDVEHDIVDSDARADDRRVYGRGCHDATRYTHAYGGYVGEEPRPLIEEVKQLPRDDSDDDEEEHKQHLVHGVVNGPIPPAFIVAPICSATHH